MFRRWSAIRHLVALSVPVNLPVVDAISVQGSFELLTS